VWSASAVLSSLMVGLAIGNAVNALGGRVNSLRATASSK
jgi:hypothetical protein